MDSTQLNGPQLIHRGAEANLYLSEVGPWKAIIKKRIPKKYRLEALDDRIRRDRTAKEAAIISETRKSGVRTPTVLSLDLDECLMTISFIPGTLVRDRLDGMGPRASAVLFREIGRQVGLMHSQGIVHGDLTTSNIIISSMGDPYFVDFGLSEHSDSTEDRAVDIHLFRRSVETSHRVDIRAGFNRFAEGYEVVLGDDAFEVQKKASEIAKRGRYFAIR